MATPLTGIFSPRARKTVYTVYATIGLVIGCVQAGYGAVSTAGVPDWLKVVLSIYAFLGTAIGATAASNVTMQPNTTPRRTRSRGAT